MLARLGHASHAAAATAIAIGTLTKNTEPHQKCSSSQPPVIGPAATAIPATALQMPIAFARSLGSRNMLVMIASVAGKISAAPMPIRARPTISVSAESAAPA